MRHSSFTPLLTLALVCTIGLINAGLYAAPSPGGDCSYNGAILAPTNLTYTGTKDTVDLPLHPGDVITLTTSFTTPSPDFCDNKLGRLGYFQCGTLIDVHHTFDDFGQHSRDWITSADFEVPSGLLTLDIHLYGTAQSDIGRTILIASLTLPITPVPEVAALIAELVPAEWHSLTHSSDYQRREYIRRE